MKRSVCSLDAIISCGLRNLWKIVRTIDFWIEVLATMLGVLAALYLANLQQQQHLDSITAQRLHMVVLESQYNGSTVKEIFEVFSKGTPNTIMLKQTDTSMAIAAINDQNIVSFLPLHKLSLLVSYIDSQETLNHTLKLYNDYLLLGTEVTSNNKEAFSENIRGNAASAAIMCDVLQDELKMYFDKKLYDHERIQSLEQKIEQTKRGILSGEIKIQTEK
ncbi:MAG: hypothetical protein H8E47_03415 [Anaerolineales bacterium]|nr:hypothetical protein [Anaerolineales bacterium]